MYEVLLFELEGVLVETGPARRAALLRSLADDGLAVSAEQYEDACAGFPVHEAAVAAVAAAGQVADPTGLELIALRAERYFAASVGQGVSLAPGARDFVERAAARARLGVVTRASRREADMLLRLAGWEGTFEMVVTADDAHARKPSPDPYEVALHRLARRRLSRPARILALEDGHAGILSACAVRIGCVAVGRIPVHHAVTADAYVPSLEGHTVESLGELVERGREYAR
jgi:HAD superfamily hydrolase (TIGR01509 family)